MTRFSFWGLVALVLGLFVLPARAAKLPDVDIPYTKFQLPNGLTVIVHEDHKAPIVAVSVWYHVGSKDEPAGKSGFAHLFEHLMFNGSEHHDDEYFKPLEKVGVTDINGTTWLDRTNYFETVPKPALELALFLESDRMGHLLGAVDQKKLDNQRGVVQNEKRQGENQPYGRVFDTLQTALYPEGHPYHHTTIGSMADLNAASLEDVHNWFKQYYGPNNAVLVLAGDITLDEAKALAEKYFGDIPPGPPVTRKKAEVPFHAADTRLVMEDRVPQAHVYRVWAVAPRTAQDATLLDLAAMVLGQGKTSRLYRDLVHDRQWATNVSASLLPFELSSMFMVMAEVKPGVDIAKVEQRLDELVAEFLAKPISQDELTRAQARNIAGEIRGLEKVGGFTGKAVTLAQGEIYAGDPGFFKRQLRWMAEATPARVQEAVRQWLGRGSVRLIVKPFPKLAAQGKGIDRSKGLPQVGETPDLDFPAIVEDRLANGMRVVLAERHAVPVVQVAVQFDAGYAADSLGKLGVANLTLDMLDEGTTARSGAEIAAEAERLGAVISTNSTLDTSEVRLNAITTNLKKSLELFADVVRHPAFREEDLARQKARQIAAIRQEQNQPIGIALRKLPPILYGKDHAYGIPFTGSGTIESVKSITKADLEAFQRQWLRPDNATIFVVGDTTMAEIKPLLEKTFGNWKAPDQPLPQKNIATVEGPAGNRIIVIDRPGSPQSLILAGHLAPPTGDPQTIALTAANEILGGAFTARINMDLREDKGWSYGAYSFMPDARGQRPFLVYAPVQTDKTADSIKQIVQDLNDFLGPKPPTAEELDRVVKNSTRSLPGRYETSGAVLGAMLQNLRFGRPLDYQEHLKALYEKLDLETVTQAGRRLVHPDRLVWVVVGDKAKIMDGLKALGFAEISEETAGE